MGPEKQVFHRHLFWDLERKSAREGSWLMPTFLSWGFKWIMVSSERSEFGVEGDGDPGVYGCEGLLREGQEAPGG